MIKTNWMERKSNERVLNEIGEKISLMIHITERKMKLNGHIIRHNNFLNNLFERRIMGRRPRGRPRTNYFHDVKEKMSCESYQQLKEAAKDRHIWLTRQGVAFRA